MDNRTISVCVAILTTFCVADAAAASFDCSKAKTPDEVAVCKNPDISALDSEMGGLWYAFNAMPMAMGSSGARRDDAQQFLSDRRACTADVACLRKTYAARNQALRSGIKTVLQNMVSEQNNAQAASTPSTPVDGLVDGYAKQCRRLGGTLKKGIQPNVAIADFDGDGKPDYVLDTQPLQCDGAATAFCANNGCQVDIALSRQAYRSPTSVTGGQPTVTFAEDGDSLAVWVDGSVCKLQNRNQACWTTLSWPGGKPSRRNGIRAAK